MCILGLFDMCLAVLIEQIRLKFCCKDRLLVFAAKSEILMFLPYLHKCVGPLVVFVSSICIRMCILSLIDWYERALDDQTRLKFCHKKDLKFIVSSSQSIMFRTYLHEFWSVMDALQFNWIQNVLFELVSCM